MMNYFLKSNGSHLYLLKIIFKLTIVCFCLSVYLWGQDGIQGFVPARHCSASELQTNPVH